MITSRKDARNFIDTMSDMDFTILCDILNVRFGEKTDQRIAAEKKFVSEVKKAEDSVKAGNYVTLEQMHDILGV